MPIHLIYVPPGGNEQDPQKHEITRHTPAQPEPFLLTPEMKTKIGTQNEPGAYKERGQNRFHGPGEINSRCREDQEPEHEEQSKWHLNQADAVETFGFLKHDYLPVKRIMQPDAATCGATAAIAQMTFGLLHFIDKITTTIYFVPILTASIGW
jgi:hypothetical protein